MQTFSSPFDFELFSPSLRLHYRDFITTMAFAEGLPQRSEGTPHSSLLLQVYLPVRSHGISRLSFLVYLPNLPA